MSSKTINTVTPVQTDLPNENIGYSALVIAIVAGAIGPIVIRMALGESVSPISIVAIRLLLATFILTPFVLRNYREQVRLVARRQLILIALSGFWLAVHFMGFTSSLSKTSVLITTVIVATNPLWAAILETVFLRAKAHSLVWIGIACAIIGGAVIAFGGTGAGLNNPDPLGGGLLALLGAIASAIYLLIGRSVQTRISLIPYIWMVYGFAALTATTFSIISGNPLTGYSAAGYFWVVVITFLLQLLTHGSINLALRYFAATYVSIFLQVSVIGNVFFAFIFFDEVPKELQLIGAATVIIGVILATIGRGRHQPQKSAIEA